MKRNSLSYRYKKAINDHSTASSKEKRNIKYNYVTKLFFRIFLSSILLLLFVVVDKISYSSNKKYVGKNLINKNWNILKITGTINTLFGEFIIIKDDLPVDSFTMYDNIEYVDGTNLITNVNFEGVYSCESGVVTKIKKDDNNKYTITIQSMDDIVYEYSNLENIDFSIYNYVAKGEIIGSSTKEQEVFKFKLVISKDNERYSFYDEIKN